MYNDVVVLIIVWLCSGCVLLLVGVRKIFKNIYSMGTAQLNCVMKEVGPEDATDRAYYRTSCTAYDEKGNILTKGK